MLDNAFSDETVECGVEGSEEAEAERLEDVKAASPKDISGLRHSLVILLVKLK